MKISEHLNKFKVLIFIAIVAIAYEARSLFGEKYTWAFAQELNGQVLATEVCRETLAESIYLDENSKKISREGNSNIFIFSGANEAYRIFGFNTQLSCEIMLNNIRKKYKKDL